MAPTSRSNGCPACGSPLVAIDLPAAGSVLTMRSCGRCEGRWWSRNGEVAELRQVLASVAATRRERRQLVALPG
jgi:Zn-finger nucleic acid-binding protein